MMALAEAEFGSACVVHMVNHAFDAEWPPFGRGFCTNKLKSFIQNVLYALRSTITVEKEEHMSIY